jgi:hypothetical protein
MLLVPDCLTRSNPPHERLANGNPYLAVAPTQVAAAGLFDPPLTGRTLSNQGAAIFRPGDVH